MLENGIHDFVVHSYNQQEEVQAQLFDIDGELKETNLPRGPKPFLKLSRALSKKQKAAASEPGGEEEAGTSNTQKFTEMLTNPRGRPSADCNGD